MPVKWEKVCDYTDIIFEKAEGIGKITINQTGSAQRFPA